MTYPRRRFHALPTAAALLASVLAAGCEDEPPPNSYRKVVEIREVPEVVLRSFKDTLPGVKPQDAWQNVDRATRSLHSYEVRGRDPRGKIREARITPDGKVLETE